MLYNLLAARQKLTNHFNMNRIVVSSLLIIFITQVCSSQNKEIINVELNKQFSSEIGESVVSTGEIIKSDGIKITKDFEVKSGFTKFKYEEGDIYPFVKIKKGYKIYYSKRNFKDGRYWGVAFNIKNPNESFPILISTVGIIAKLKKHNIEDKFINVEIVDLCDNCYQLEFIYGGKTGDILKFTYREFIGDIARPSFFQNIEYDVSVEKIIGFKGLRLKILDSSNTSLNYEILRNFDPLR